MGARWEKLGIIAGGGGLPLVVAEACRARGEPVFLIRLTGFADADLTAFAGVECGIAELGKVIRELKAAGCDAVTLAGVVRRPNFAALKPDWRGAALLPKIISAARKGDGAMLSLLVETFEAEGLRVVGAEEAALALPPQAGSVGAVMPNADHMADMRKAAAVVEALGRFDVGQGAVVRDGFVLAVEAAEGTDEMLRRCQPLVAALSGGGGRRERRGVLLKRPKPGQELRVDLPTIGVQTVQLAADAGLAGIAIAAQASLVLDAPGVARAADAAGLFVFAYQSTDLKG